MDPVSHAIVGRLLIGVDPRQRAGRGAGVAAVLGALSPDLDAVLMPAGWDLYLRVHQMGTHTIAGSLACAVLVATVVRLCTRASRWPRLFLAAWAGALSHLVLDIASGATIRLLWPLSDMATRYGVVAMGEPVIVALLVIAAIVFWRWPAKRVNAAVTGLALVTMVLVGKAAVRTEAQRMYDVATVREGVQASVVEAEWNTISQWVVLDRTADRVRRWAVDTTHRTVTRDIDLPLARGDGPFALSARAAVVQNFLAAHEFPLVVTTTDDASTAVRWSDLQYCWAPGAPRAVRAVVGSAVRPADIPIACGLWFNTTLNGDGTFGRQFVTIGEWEQERAPR